MPRQSVGQLWNRVPTLHWPGGEESAESPEPPQVSANVARTTQTEPLSANGTAERTVAPSEMLPEPEVAANGSAASTSAPNDIVTAAAPETAPALRIRELKAALSADTERLLSSPGSATGPHPLRLRVDGLLRRAQDLLKGGELKEARRTAQLAAELSDSVSLEFLPTEDRPNDLLREIDGRLESTASTLHEAERDQAAAAQPLSPRKDFATNSDPAASELQRSNPNGTAAANVPRMLRARLVGKVESQIESATEEDVAEVPPSMTALPEELTSGSSREPNAMLSQDVPWGQVGLDSGIPQSAPEPPTIEAILPLPGFRERQAAAAAPQPNPPPADRELLAWTDWLALAVLAVLLGTVGLALGARRWRYG